jgi:hypothetical protein
MKIVAKFHGQVKQLNPVPDPSIVSLTNLETNETAPATAITENLLNAGINYNNCKFEIIIQESPTGAFHSTLSKLNDPPLKENEPTFDI